MIRLIVWSTEGRGRDGAAMTADEILLDNLAGLLNLHTDKNPFALSLDDQAKVAEHRAKMKVVAQTIVHRLEGGGGPTVEILKELANAHNDLAEYRTAQVFIDQALEMAERQHVLMQDSIAFMMTDRCNLRCKHCFIFNEAVFHPVKRKNELSAMDYVTIFNSLRGRDIDIHITGGGEVFARTDFEEIVLVLARQDYGYRVSMQTNGHFPERLKHILDRAPKFFHTVQFSMDGLEEVHNKVRGQGNWMKLMDSIAETREAGIDVSIITTVMQDNLFTLAEIREFAKSIGVKNHRFQMYFEHSKIALAGIQDASDFMSERDRSLIYHDLQAPGQGCMAGIRTCVVRPDGRVEACRESYSGNVPPIPVVNLRDYDLDASKALRSWEAFHHMRKVKNCVGCAAFCDR